ncbi:MAG: hypothetical protein R2852_07350 [Bacteroidia bacterium]
METNKMIPEEIFDYLEDYTFDELNLQQKELVLKAMTAEEYMELFSVISELKIKKQSDGHAIKESNIASLMQAFESKHTTASKSKKVVYMQWWNIAAVLVLGSLLAVFLNTFNKKTLETGLTLKPDIDTIYVTKLIASESPIADTVFVEVPVYKKSKSRYKKVEMASTDETRGIFPPSEHVVSLDEINDLANIQKGNSLKEESLLKEIGMFTY